MANKITYVNKVENNGSTQDGLLFALNLNEIKEVVNTNRDDFVDKNPTQGQVSGTNLLIKNATGSTLFSVDLSSFSGGGSGYVHPEPMRSDTSDTAQSLSNGGSFTVINQVSSNLQGHITGVRTKQLTLPSQTTIPTSAALDSNTLKFYNASTLLFSADLSSLGGGGSIGTLEQVTTAGNTTTKQIICTNPNGIVTPKLVLNGHILTIT